jgi:hypothetical protein
MPTTHPSIPNNAFQPLAKRAYKVSDSVYIKRGTSLEVQREVDTIEFVQRHTSIPLPSVIDLRHESDSWFSMKPLPFLDTCLITESGPSFTFKTRHLGDSETVVSRIPRLWSVKTGWFWAQQRETEQTSLCCAFRPPRGSKCSSHSAPLSVMGSHGHQPDGTHAHQPSHIQRHPCEEIHPCYPTTIGVSGNLS